MNPRNLSLMGAVTDGDTEVVRALLAAGSDVNKTASGGQSLLILAILFRRTQILKLLLDAGADPKQCDSLGLNAIDWAQRKGFAEGLILLNQIQTKKQETPPASVPSQNEKPNTRASRGLTQFASSDEKSRRWVAGLKRRIDEEATHKVNEVQLPPAPPAPPATEIEATRTEPPPVVINERAAQTAATVSEPPVTSFPAERVESVETDTSQRSQTYMTAAPLFPSDDVEISQPPVATGGPPLTSTSRKKCPKCNAVYRSELLAYCAVDMTPLVDANATVVVSPPETTKLPLVWLLIVFSFVVAAGVIYVTIPNLRSAQNAPAETSPKQASGNSDSPLVSGELSGKQLDVPPPEYPATARSEHVSGTVTIRVTVNKKGRVIAVKAVEGDWRLRNAAIAAAQKATFSAEKLNGRGAVGTIAYTFKE
ncbi:MAG TPA: TonB family protein [Pyrinomonadaceae bacterium]|nr:TonB family protein [Pyrinomonadaceae bacterium]